MAARRRLADAVIACGLPHLGRGDLALGARETRRRAAARSRGCAGSARPRSISPGSRPAGFDAYWERNLSPWDIAAGLIMVREAGGYVTDLDGSETTPSTVDVLAGNETIHRELLKVLKAAGKD